MNWSALLPSLGVAVALGAAASAQSKPNIVLIYADDLGYGDVSANFPEGKIRTPSIDALARQGTLFTDAHSSSAICSPSRYALLTGRYHWRSFHNIVESFEPPVFKDGEPTLPEMLRQAGYHTACVGKWHLGWDWGAIRVQGGPSGGGGGLPAEAFDWSRPIPGGPLARGFDHYYGDDVINFPPYTWIVDNQVQTPPTEPMRTPSKSPPEGDWETRPGPMAKDWDFAEVSPRLTRYAAEWIERQKNSQRPFFLYFALHAPHTPIIPAPEFRGKSGVGPYGDYVLEADAAVKAVMDALDRAGLAQNTIVIFSSDNGPERLAYPRLQQRGHRSMGPLRGLKRDIYEGGHRVPFIVRWPGQVPAGRVSAGLVSQIDLMATLAAVAGQELSPGVAEDSHNLLPLWKGEIEVSPRTALVYNTYANRFAIRRGPWVLINTQQPFGSKVPSWFNEKFGYPETEPPVALYNLDQDLGQRQNLAAERPEEVAALRTLLGQIRAFGEVRPASAMP